MERLGTYERRSSQRQADQIIDRFSTRRPRGSRPTDRSAQPHDALRSRARGFATRLAGIASQGAARSWLRRRLMQAGYIVVGVSGGLVLVAGCTHSRWAWWPMARESRTATAAAAVAETPQAPMTVNHAPPPENAPRSVAMPVSYPQPANGPPVSAVPDSPVPDGFSEFEPAKIMARVGEEVILAGDLMGPINQALAPYHGVKSPEEIAATREALLRRQVQTAVENKLMYVAALRNIPIDKRKDALPQIWERLHTKFDEEELPKA